MSTCVSVDVESCGSARFFVFYKIQIFMFRVLLILNKMSILLYPVKKVYVAVNTFGGSGLAVS